MGNPLKIQLVALIYLAMEQGGLLRMIWHLIDCEQSIYSTSKRILSTFLMIKYK
jgi:hypothetical protein